MLKAGIIGATGYTGLALISALVSHPDVTVSLITSNTYKYGKKGARASFQFSKR